MEVVKAYDVHANLQAEIHELKAEVLRLEERVAILEDDFYWHTHDEDKPFVSGDPEDEKS